MDEGGRGLAGTANRRFLGTVFTDMLGSGPSAGHPAAALWPEPQDPDPAASLHGGGDRGPPGRQHRLLAEACPAPDLAAPAQPGAALSLPTAPVDHVLAPITTQPARRSRPLRAAL